MNKLETKINKLLDHGTRIVSFKYHDKIRNVLVGDSRCLSTPVWGKVQNRAIREHKGEKYLVALVANESKNSFDRSFKTFKLADIENFSVV